MCFNHANFTLKLKALGQRPSSVDSGHFEEKNEKDDVDGLLHSITVPITLSECKRIEMENG